MDGVGSLPESELPVVTVSAAAVLDNGTELARVWVCSFPTPTRIMALFLNGLDFIITPCTLVFSNLLFWGTSSQQQALPFLYNCLVAWVGIQPSRGKGGDASQGLILSLLLPSALPSGLASLLLWPLIRHSALSWGPCPHCGRMDEGRSGFIKRMFPQVEVSSSHHSPLQGSDFQGPRLSRGFFRKTKPACARPGSAHINLAFSGCSGNITQSELDLLYLFPHYLYLQRSQIKATQ